MTAGNDPSPTRTRAGSSKFPLCRLVPLIVIAVASAVVIAMGWHRQLSFETLARHDDALRDFIATHEMPALAAYMALYIAAVGLSIPVGVFLTVTGGVLFGALLGGVAVVVRARCRADCIVMMAQIGV